MKGFTGPGCGVILLLAACATMEAPPTAVYEDANRAVGLQRPADGYDGKRFSHPVSLTKDDVAAVMRGLYVVTQDVPLSRLAGGGKAVRRPAFSQKEIAFFAPLFVEGLRRATPDEVVTFYETAEISERDELTTSGAMFVRGDVMYVVLSNYGVRTAIWQDNEQYRAPVRHRPLTPIDPEPGRLVFVPAELMVRPGEGFVTKLLRGQSWRVGVRFREIR